MGEEEEGVVTMMAVVVVLRVAMKEDESIWVILSRMKTTVGEKEKKYQENSFVSFYYDDYCDLQRRMISFYYGWYVLELSVRKGETFDDASF
jgi:hypothetical protein